VRHVPCIRVCAPLENRVRWLMERLETDDPDIAQDEIARSDAAHATRMRHAFGVTLGDPLLYDLVLNTGRVSIESCVEQVVALARRPEFQPTDASVAHLRNLALQARIQTSLRAQDTDGHINITPEVDGGRVVLRGVVVDDRERHRVAAITSAVPGVTSVENALRVMKATHRYADDGQAER